MKKFNLILVLILVGIPSYGQSAHENSGNGGSNAKEFNLSVSSGFSFFGPQEDMESAFIAAGFDDTSPAGWGSGETAHPYSRKSLVYDIEATYYFNDHMGVTANGGLINNIEVLGYEAVGIGNYLFLDSKIKSLSLNFAYRTMNNRHTFFVGPSYSIHTVKDVSAGNISPDNNIRKPGAYLGYAYKAFIKKYWAVVLKATYRWAPKSEIGPFISESLENTSEFPLTEVSASCLNVGLGLMLRLPQIQHHK